MSEAFDRIVDALNGHGCTVRANGDGKAQAQCAAHDDSNPSLSLASRADGKGVLLHCHTGCDVADVVAALGLTMSDLFDDDGMRAAWNPQRDYTYPGGRRVHRKPNKEFPQSGNKADDSLFHADRIGDATTVYVPEGEKDVEVIEAVGGTAVCSAMGAGKAHLADWSPLQAKQVIVVADKDDAGRTHAAQIGQLLNGVAASVRTVEAKQGKDVAEHVAAGLLLDELVDVAVDAHDSGDGAALLDEVLEQLCRYVIFPTDAAATGTALWVAATHGLPAWQHATRMIIKSPQKRCGKSRLLDIVKLLSFNPMPSTDMSTAVIYRSIGDDDHKTPTLLIDEADALFGTKSKAEQNEDLRGLLNAGFQRDRTVWRCVGPNQVPTQFATFSMCALAAIKGLPDTIVDRSVVVDLKRRQPGEAVARFRIRRDTAPLLKLRARLTAWVREGERLTALGDAEPEMPETVEDRQQDAWEPLIAIADAAGGHWPELARAACLDLCGQADDSDDGIQLLADIEAIFAAVTDAFLRSSQLVRELKDRDESSWRDNELTPHKLARMLKDYGVRPRPGPGYTARGYWRVDFKDSFARYNRREPSDRRETASDQLEQGENR